MHITIDFETAYDNEYSLTNIPMAQYIRDPRFEIIMLSYKVNNEPTRWCSYDLPKMRAELAKLDWENAVVIAHNAMFDGAILEWVLGFKPKAYFCTQMGARPFLAPFHGKVSLRNCARVLGFEEKLDEVEKVKGMWRDDFDEDALLRYAVYGMRDTDLSYKIARKLVPLFPADELQLIDLTVKAFTRPKLHLDKSLLEEAYEQEVRRKELVLRRAGINDPSEVRSAPKFAAKLKALGVNPPIKKSPTTGKGAYAFAKTDPGFRKLLEHATADVRRLAKARLVSASSIEETRLKRFIELADQSPLLPVPQLYYGAHTGRWSGLDKLNLQNLGRKSPLRSAIIAPPGYKIIAADLSQIEARMVATLAGQDDLVEAFANGDDVYCLFASDLFGKPVTKDDESERFVGKVAILQLGFQSGSTKFHDTMAAFKRPIPREMAQRVVTQYRQKYPHIVSLWSKAELAIRAMMTGEDYEIGPVRFQHGQAILPNNMPIYYPDLRRSNGETVYRGMNNYGQPITKRLYGGALTENIVQALARLIMARAKLALARHGLRFAMSVHDELIFCVPERHVPKCMMAVDMAMTATVPWLPNLPVACEIKYGDNYGECK